MKRMTAWLLVILFALGMMPLNVLAADAGIPVQRVELSQTSLEMAVGDVAELQMSLYPENSGDGSWIWRSSDASVVRMIGSGLLEAVSEGTAEITLEASGKTAVCQVVVSGFAVRSFGLRRDSVIWVPLAIQPTFYEAGQDSAPGEIIESVAEAEQDGMVPYRIALDAGAAVAVRGVDGQGNSWGGMTVTLPESREISFRAVQCRMENFAGDILEGTVDVSCNQETENVLPGDGGRFLLAANRAYTYTTQLTETGTKDYKNLSTTETLTAGKEIWNQILMPELWYCKTITAPSDAKVQIYGRRSGSVYYVYDEYLPKLSRDNGDGTTTHQFSVYRQNGTNKEKISDINWRVTMGDVVKAGYWAENQKAITVTKSMKPDQQNSGFAEDGVLLNVNSQNALNLSVGGTHELRAYRAWEIINSHSGNSVIMPEFTYDIITGTDVVKLEDAKAPINGSNCWKTLTALKPGFAVIEVSGREIDIFGSGGMDGTYDDSDPARTGLLVVQVGGGISANFGIDCFASSGIKGTKNVSYNPSSKKVWDAEFDTLYFTGDEGLLRLNPSIQGEVAVSHDKGQTFQTLDKDSGGYYTAPIVSGNNILRLITNDGIAYQVVRGDRIQVRVTEVENKGKQAGVVEAGETVRVYLDGLHQPFPKMAGIYNPGFGENTDGYSQVHLNYTFGGKSVYGPGRQYDFITQANYLEITLPKDAEESVTLTDGYIGLGVYGKNGANILESANNHRGMKEPTVNTNATTTFHTRSILPDITIHLGDEAENLPPVILPDAPKSGSVAAGKNYQISNLATIFQDPEGAQLYYRVSVDNGAEQYISGNTYTYEAKKAGTVVLTFRADDGTNFSEKHTITLTVTESEGNTGNGSNGTNNNGSNNNSGNNSSTNNSTGQLEFGLSKSEIAGYVTISFEDRAVRLAEELNSPSMSYPKALGTIVSATKVPFKQGETIAQVTLRLLDEKNIGYSYTGSATSNFYLQSIKNFEVNNTPYTSMGEFDAGQGSGWMITWNDWFIDSGASRYKVSNGDRVCWQYTCQYGADIGDSYYEENQTGSQNQQPDTDQTDDTDGKKAEAVEKLIQALPENIGIAQEKQVKAAADAYEALSASQKAMVDETLLKKLKQAKVAIGKLTTTDAEKASAQEVEKLIDAIGTPVTQESEERIQKARKAYDALSDAQKYLVSNYEKLTAAEEALGNLKTTVNKEARSALTGSYLENLGTPGVGSVGGEWMVVGLKRAGRTILDEEGYYRTVEQFVRENINEKNQLHRAKSTENSRMILALTAMGKDVTDVAGYNLLLGLTDLAYVQHQGINGPIWALIAFDSGNYPVPAGDVSRDKLLEVILSAQLPDGGWALSGERSDPDMTGMALQALAPYVEGDTAVKHAVEKALETLSAVQNADGSFSSVDGANSESIAQVITALAALGIDADTDARFIKNGISALDALMTYQIAGGGFCHILGGELDGMSTEQAYCALVAYERMLQKQNFLYDMTDVMDAGGDVIEEENTEPTELPTEPAMEKPAQKKNNTLIWTGVMAVCAAAIVGVLLNRKKLFGNFL